MQVPLLFYPCIFSSHSFLILSLLVVAQEVFLYSFLFAYFCFSCQAQTIGSTCERFKITDLLLKPMYRELFKLMLCSFNGIQGSWTSFSCDYLETLNWCLIWLLSLALPLSDLQWWYLQPWFKKNKVRESIQFYTVNFIF